MANGHLRNLPVPFFSQRQNDYILQEKYEIEIKDPITQKIIHKKGDLKREISMGCRSCNISSVMRIM